MAQNFGSPEQQEPTPPTVVVNEQGQSTTSAVSQKLFTNSLTATNNALDALGGIPDGVVNQNGGGLLKSWVGTQAQYDAIASKDANTAYMVTE